MTPSDTKRVSELLRIIADAVERSPNTLEVLLEEVGQRSNITKSTRSREEKLSRPDQEKRRTEEIITTLQNSVTRDEALSRLRKHKLTRRDLVEIARARSIHVTKEDSVSWIEEKLVEALVGNRLNSEAIRGHRGNEGSRFVEINRRIIQQTNERILHEIAHHRFKLVFNPESKGAKDITFRSDGQIGEGRNANEDSWRVAGGRLELLNESGDVYSRFLLLPDGRFQHTNDPDTQSIKGQYLERVGKV